MKTSPDRDDPARRVRAVAVSPDIRFGDIDGNLGRVADAFESAAGAAPQLIVAPELASSGYVFADRGEASTLAIGRDDARLRALTRTLGAQTVAVVGFCERDGDDLFNSAAVLTREGIVAVYAKSHLWAAETTIFTPGSAPGIVVDTPIARLGVAICYDNEFPEVPRSLALAGADILALPVNWPLVARPTGEHPPETIQAMAAARSSRLPTLIADRHGSERGVAWTGGTAIIDGDGWPVAVGSDTAEAILDITPGVKTIGPWNDLFGDRRPEIYPQHLSRTQKDT